MAGYAYLTAWLLLLGVFAVSAGSKLRGREALAAFAASVRLMRLVPERWARPTALAVAFAEAAVVALLAVPPLAPAGFGLAAVLLVAFVAATAALVRRGTAVPCRCFGPSTTPFGPAHLVRGSILLAVAAAGLLGSPPGTYEVAAVAVSAFAAAFGVVLVVFFADFVSLFSPSAPPARPVSRQRQGG